MSTRSIITNEAGQHVIVTVNGRTTSTTAMYTKRLKTYKPLPNGFNHALALDVLATITRNQELWNQNAWRIPITLDWLTKRLLTKKRTRKQAATKALRMAAIKEAEAPACGTAMCFAGWVNEKTGVDWVMDTDFGASLLEPLLEAEPERLNQMPWDMVLVRRDEALPGALTDDGRRRWVDHLVFGDLLEDYLTARGFALDTHAVLTTSAAALNALGLGSDWLRLFHGENDLATITRIVEAYAIYGPRPNLAGLVYVNGYMAYESASIVLYNRETGISSSMIAEEASRLWDERKGYYAGVLPEAMTQWWYRPVKETVDA